MFLPPATSTSGSPAIGTPGGSATRVSNATLSGLPQSTLAPLGLQRVLNAAARLVCDLRPREHVTNALIDLHWLPVAARIEFKICVLAYQSLDSTAPAYRDE